MVAGKIYNVGTGVQTSIRQVVDEARSILPIMEQPVWGTMPARQWDTSCWVADHERITKDLGSITQCSFDRGFKLTVEWLKSDKTMLNFYQSNRDLPK